MTQTIYETLYAEYKAIEDMMYASDATSHKAEIQERMMKFSEANKSARESGMVNANVMNEYVSSRNNGNEVLNFNSIWNVTETIGGCHKHFDKFTVSTSGLSTYAEIEATGLYKLSGLTTTKVLNRLNDTYVEEPAVMFTRV